MSADPNRLEKLFDAESDARIDGEAADSRKYDVMADGEWTKL